MIIITEIEECCESYKEIIDYGGDWLEVDEDTTCWEIQNMIMAIYKYLAGNYN